jgi:hypothetical protein
MDFVESQRVLKREMTMTVIESGITVRPTSAKARIGHQPSQRGGIGSNPYSPVLCVSLLLLIGLIAKISPAMHAFLGQG